MEENWMKTAGKFKHERALKENLRKTEGTFKEIERKTGGKL